MVVHETRPQPVAVRPDEEIILSLNSNIIIIRTDCLPEQCTMSTALAIPTTEEWSRKVIIFPVRWTIPTGHEVGVTPPVGTVDTTYDNGTTRTTWMLPMPRSTAATRTLAMTFFPTRDRIEWSENHNLFLLSYTDITILPFYTPSSPPSRMPLNPS